MPRDDCRPGTCLAPPVSPRAFLPSCDPEGPDSSIGFFALPSIARAGRLQLRAMAAQEQDEAGTKPESSALERVVAEMSAELAPNPGAAAASGALSPETVLSELGF